MTQAKINRLKNRQNLLENKARRIESQIQIERVLQLEKWNCFNDFQRGHKGHFFDEPALRYFNSRISEYLIKGCFITSEKHRDEARYYTVRIAGIDGSIDDIFGFQAFTSSQQAEKELRKLPDNYSLVILLAKFCWNIGDISGFKRALKHRQLKQAAAHYIEYGSYLKDDKDFILEWVKKSLVLEGTN